MYFSYILGHCLHDILNKIIWNQHSDFCSVTCMRETWKIKTFCGRPNSNRMIPWQVHVFVCNLTISDVYLKTRLFSKSMKQNYSIRIEPFLWKDLWHFLSAKYYIISFLEEYILEVDFSQAINIRPYLFEPLVAPGNKESIENLESEVENSDIEETPNRLVNTDLYVLKWFYYFIFTKMNDFTVFFLI